MSSTLYQGNASQASSTNHNNTSLTSQNNQTDTNQALAEYGAAQSETIQRKGANQINTDYGSISLDLNQSMMERHIAEAKVQLNIARDQLRTLTKANRDLIAGNVTSHVSTGSITIGGVLYAVVESKLDFGVRLGRLQFSGALGVLPVGVNSDNGGAELFLPPEQLASLGTIDIQVDATPVQCFICWRHNTRILGAFYGTGSGVSVFSASGTGIFRQIY